VCVPVIFLGEGLVDAVIKVLVVRKDDMATDIVEKALWSHVSRGQTTGLFVGINDHPRGTFNVVQALSRTESGWTSSNDQNINVGLSRHYDSMNRLL